MYAYVACGSLTHKIFSTEPYCCNECLDLTFIMCNNLLEIVNFQYIPILLFVPDDFLRLIDTFNVCFTLFGRKVAFSQPLQIVLGFMGILPIYDYCIPFIVGRYFGRTCSNVIATLPIDFTAFGRVVEAFAALAIVAQPNRWELHGVRLQRLTVVRIFLDHQDTPIVYQLCAQ